MHLPNLRPGSKVVCVSPTENLKAGKQYIIKYNTIKGYDVLLCLENEEGFFNSELFNSECLDFTVPIEQIRRASINS